MLDIIYYFLLAVICFGGLLCLIGGIGNVIILGSRKRQEHRLATQAKTITDRGVYDFIIRYKTFIPGWLVDAARYSAKEFRGLEISEENQFRSTVFWGLMIATLAAAVLTLIRTFNGPFNLDYNVVGDTPYLTAIVIWFIVLMITLCGSLCNDIVRTFYPVGKIKDADVTLTLDAVFATAFDRNKFFTEGYFLGLRLIRFLPNGEYLLADLKQLASDPSSPRTSLFKLTRSEDPATEIESLLSDIRDGKNIDSAAKDTRQYVLQFGADVYGILETRKVEIAPLDDLQEFVIGSLAIELLHGISGFYAQTGVFVKLVDEVDQQVIFDEFETEIGDNKYFEVQVGRLFRNEAEWRVVADVGNANTINPLSEMGFVIDATQETATTVNLITRFFDYSNGIPDDDVKAWIASTIYALACRYNAYGYPFVDAVAKFAKLDNIEGYHIFDVYTLPSKAKLSIGFRDTGTGVWFAFFDQEGNFLIELKAIAKESGLIPYTEIAATISDDDAALLGDVFTVIRDTVTWNNTSYKFYRLFSVEDDLETVVEYLLLSQKAETMIMAIGPEYLPETTDGKYRCDSRAKEVLFTPNGIDIEIPLFYVGKTATTALHNRRLLPPVFMEYGKLVLQSMGYCELDGKEAAFAKVLVNQTSINYPLYADR